MVKYNFYSFTIIFCYLIRVNAIIRDGQINIAAIFQSPNIYNPAKTGFEDGIQYANNKILSGIKLNPIIKYVKEDDTFDAIKKTCNLLEKNSVWAIFTAQSLPINWIISSIVNNLQVPNIQNIWDYSSSKKIFSPDIKLNFTFNLYPDASLLSQAFKDWTEASDIKAVTIIYERNEDLIFIKDLLELNSQVYNIRISIKEHHADNNDYKKLLKDSKIKNGDNFILSISNNKLESLLTQAQELNLITEYNKYLITNLDSFKLDYEYLGDSNKNITTMSLINLPNLKETLAEIARNYRHEEALMFDAVTMFAKTLAQLKSSAAMLNSPVVSCKRSENQAWSSGNILMSHIKNTIYHGITGPIQFNQYGQRVNFTLRILTVQQSDTSFNQSGIWTAERKIEISRTKKEDVEQDIIKLLKNRKAPLRVVSMLNKPYILPNPSGEDEEETLIDFINLTKNYTGFCVELMDKLQERLDFAYEIILLNTTTSKDLLEAVKQQKADIAIADITITKERQAEVDFTMPFLTLGIAILFSKSTEETKNLFSFMKPFHLKVWLLLATAFIGVSLLLYIISRISPYEWVSEHPCDDEPEEFENQFSLGNCLWFVLGSIMQQGSDLAPRAPSTRLLANFWAFFTLIMVSSYTANLAAVLTLSGLELEIKSVEDLAKQIKVKYGLSQEGSTHKFFKNSQHPIYQRMYSYMESIEKTEKVYTKGNVEGVKRVLKGEFAFLMESTTLEFFTNQNCNLTQIGNLLDRKGYGIVLKQGSPYTSLFSAAILKLQEEQYLSNLRTKWLNSYPAALRQIKTPWLKECPKIEEDSGGAKEMTIPDVGGVFIVLIVGLLIGLYLSTVEVCWKAKKIARHEREHILAIIWKELKRIFRLGGSRTTENILLLPQTSLITNQTNYKIVQKNEEQTDGEDLDQIRQLLVAKSKQQMANLPSEQVTYSNLSAANTNGLPTFPVQNNSIDLNPIQPILSNTDPKPNKKVSLTAPTSPSNFNSFITYPATAEPLIGKNKKDNQYFQPFIDTDSQNHNKKQKSNVKAPDTDNSNLRRRSYITESPIVWPAPNANIYDHNMYEEQNRF